MLPRRWIRPISITIPIFFVFPLATLSGVLLLLRLFRTRFLVFLNLLLFPFWLSIKTRLLLLLNLFFLVSLIIIRTSFLVLLNCLLFLFRRLIIRIRFLVLLYLLLFLVWLIIIRTTLLVFLYLVICRSITVKYFLLHTRICNMVWASCPFTLISPPPQKKKPGIYFVKRFIFFTLTLEF